MARKRSRQTGPAYFSTFQVASMLGVSPPTVVNWVDRGLLVAHRTPGMHRRIKREDLVAFAREHEYPLAPEVFNGGTTSSGVADAASGPPKVLVVDDDPDFCEVVLSYLTLKNDFEVRVADSGFAAGLAVAEFKPQIILMDIVMDGMDGFEALRMLQMKPETRDIPVVACTGYAQPDILDRVRREPFAALFQKSSSFRLEDIVRVLRESLARGARATAR